MARDEAIREQAAAWAVRTGDPGFDDWDAFTRWLEEDRAHSAAYDEIMLAVDQAVVALPTLPQAENDDEPLLPPQRRRRWYGGAMAAALAGLLAFGAWQMRGGTYVVETAPGETRVVELAGGGEIALGGGTRLILDRREPRVATLERGQALFTLRHDSGQPFALTVGEDTLVDVGTVFDVELTAERMTVAVSEGAVLFNPGQQNVRVAPGQMLSSAPGSDAFRLAAISLDQVGEWHEGRLTFDDEPLAEVAADLSRATGRHFAVAPGASGLRVSGSLLVEPVRSDPGLAGELLGVVVRPSGEGWEIGSP